MLADRVKCAVPNPGPVAVGSSITLGAAPTGYRSFLTAFGGGASAYFVLSDGAGRALTGVWTVNAATPETATITEILWNDRLGSTAGETFASACVAWCTLPARETPLLRSGPYAGLRNLMINGNPLINQRAYVSGTATTVANQYTLDRWRVVTSGQSVTWTDVAGLRTVTAPAGGMEQVIEGLGLIGGSHAVNWVGTATCTVGGASVAKGAQVTLTGGANVTVRMTGGTWSQLQIEPGPLATPFERRPVATETALCERYACTVVIGAQCGAAGGMIVPYGFPTTMRATPTMEVVLAAGTIVNASIIGETIVNARGGWFQINVATAGGFLISHVRLYSAEL